MPSPETTATTLVVGGGPVPSSLGRHPGHPRSRAPALLFDLLVEVGDPDAVGRPASTPASTAAPMSSVWMWQFHRPSPPTTRWSRRCPPYLFERLNRVIGRVQEVHDLVAEVPDRMLASDPSWPDPDDSPLQGRQVRGVHADARAGAGRRAPGGRRRAGGGTRSRRHRPLGLGQDGQHLGGAGQGVGRFAPGALDDTHQIGSLCRPDGRRRATVRMVLRPGAPRPAGQLGGVADASIRTSDRRRPHGPRSCARSCRAGAGRG